MKRVLVTGSNGFVAGRLVSHLKKNGLFVRGLDIAPPARLSEVDEFVRVDITQLSALVQALEGIDTVFHVAALFEGSEELLKRVNVDGTKNIIEACARAGVPRLVYTSSCSVVFDGKDINNGTEDLPYATGNLDPYNQSKAKAEELVLKANGVRGLNTCAVRPHSIYGPGDSLAWPKTIENARKGSLKWRLVPDTLYSSYTYVDNLCHAEFLAAKGLIEKPNVVGGNAYNINDGDKDLFWTRLYDVGEIAVPRTTMGTKALPIPFRVLYFVSWFFWRIGFPLGTFTPLVLSLASTNHYYSIEKAKKHLGYAPVMEPRKSWQITKDYFKQWNVDNPAPPPSPTKKLQLWLGVVAAVSLFGSLQAFVGTNTLKTRQYSLQPDMITPVAARLFGAWTLITCTVRLCCAFDINNRTLYRITHLTFFVALGIYVFECFVAQTIPLAHALPALFVASTSIVWMALGKPRFR